MLKLSTCLSRHLWWWQS